MQSVDVEVLRTALTWLKSGHRLVMCTVVRTWGSAPRPPGSLMILCDDGQVAGSISGGCVEDDLIDRLRSGQLPTAKPELTTYGATAEEARRFGLPCGGTVQIVLEPLSSRSGLDELLARIEKHQTVERRLTMATGAVRLGSPTQGDAVSFDGVTLRTVHGPSYRLLLIGAGQVSRYLAAMAVMLDYAVTVCDPREEYHLAWESVEGVLLSDEMPDDLAEALALDSRCAVVALTHDPALDDMALIKALKSPAFYVGALGSRSNNLRRRKRLAEFDLTPKAIARLRGPVGLNLGGLTPSEIALSILAEMTATRRGINLDRSLTDWSSSTTECRVGSNESSL
ncbi:MAG: XdhC family protein [Thiobacillaceae bacterium]